MSDIERKARELRELIDQYWSLAYAEGQERRDHDTEDGDAQRISMEIDIAIRSLIALTPPDGYVLVPVDKLFAVRQARLAMLQKASASAAGDESMWGEWATDLGFIIDLHSFPSPPEVK